MQELIVQECDKANEMYSTVSREIEEYHTKINHLFDELDSSAAAKGKVLSLSDHSVFSVEIGKRVVAKELVADGDIPVFSANVNEPFGYIDKLLINDFSLPSVLWGIDGDWMTGYVPENIAFYPTDHCGVLRCLTNDVNPRYLSHVLEKEGKKIGYSRTLRASVDRIKGIKINVPDILEQEKVVSQVILFEEKIAESEEKLSQLSGKATEILNKYLY